MGELSKQAAFMGKAAKDSKLDADLSRPDGQKKRPPLVGPAKAFGRCMADFSPRQLNVAFQVPLPGDSIWTEAFLDEWCERWPGFDRTPYDDARRSGAGAKNLVEESSPLLDSVLERLAAGKISVSDAKTEITRARL